MANTYTDLLKYRMPALGDIGWDDEVNDNSEINEFVLASILRSNVVLSGLAPSDGGGLDIDYAAGEVVVAGAQHSIGASSKSCTSGALNWLYVDDTGTVQIATSAPTGDYVAIALIDAGTSVLDRIGDARNFAEGALTIGVTYSPENYAPDTGQTGAINQHLAGIDAVFPLMTSFRNKFINGKVDHWQIATSQTSSGYGSDDKWANHNTGTTKTHSRQAFTLGQTDVPGNPKYFSRTVVNSVAGAGNFCKKEQSIESVATFAGQTCTVGFWAKADASKNIAVEFKQYFGTGGSPSSSVIAHAEKVALTNGWDFYSVTADIPSISGKTLGTNGDDALIILFWFDAGSNYDSHTDTLGQQSGTFDMVLLQSEKGSVAHEFEDRPEAIEQLMCERYLEVYDDTNGSPVFNGFTAYQTTLSYVSLAWKRNKPRNPTMTISYSGLSFWDSSGALRTVTNVTSGGSKKGGGQLFVYVSTGQSLGAGCQIQFVGSSKLIINAQ